MLRENSKILQTMHQVWDICLTAAAFVLAYLIKKYLLPEPWRGLSTAPNYYALLLLCIIVWYVVFRVSGVYRPFRKQAFGRIAMRVAQSVTICAMVVLFVLFLVKEQQSISRIFLVLFIILDIFLLLCSKWALHTVLRELRKRGYNSRNVLIVGGGERAGEIARSIEQRPESGFRVIGCLSVGGTEQNGCGKGGPLAVIGEMTDLQQILTDHVVDELVFAEPLRNIPDAARHINFAEQMGVCVHIMPEWGLRSIGFKPRVSILGFENIFGIPTLSMLTTPDHNPSIAVKNMFDFISSGVGLLVCSIPFALIALAIKVSSPGPVFYRQERVGQNGRRFTLYKFRTMIDGADRLKEKLLDKNESDGPVFKIRKDPRVVPWVGTFLRKTSLDELPQLINVFRGEMSLVGPRPPLPEEITEYGMDQRRRLSMKPGITCLWQIAPRRNDISFQQWVNMDLEYIDNWSLWLDFKILLKTVWVVITGQGR